jgi:hypothetical protein
LSKNSYALILIALGAISPGLAGQQHTESAHRIGPHGLAGWTLDYPFPDHPEDHYPRVLVISRNGRVITRITGKHYIWNWIFWNDGRQVAYEDGPPHFIMSCILADVVTGRHLEDVDCFMPSPDGSPSWLNALQSVH